MNKIITLGNELLKQKSAIVTEFSKDMREYSDLMFEIMTKFKGIGLAAVQIGNLKQIFVINIPKDKPRIFINPEIIETSLEQVVYEEGCLSIPGINAEVVRPYYVKIQALDIKGKPFTLQAEDILARVIQHEFDHLQGTLFVDRLQNNKKQKLEKEFYKKINQGK